MPSSDSRTWLWIILAVALVLRVGAAIGLQMWLDRQPGRMFLIEGDADGYWRLAEALAGGNEYAVYTPPRRVLRMPGFPAVLAVPIALFEHPMLPARLMLAGIGTFACGLVWCLGRTLFDTRIANIAAGVTAISPAMIGFSPVVLGETTFAAALVASLIAMAWVVQVSGWRIADHGRQLTHSESPTSSIQQPASRMVHPASRIALGLLTGGLIALACYVRPSWLLAGPLFGLGVIITAAQKGRAIVMAACVMVGLLGLLLPWGLRNLRVTGHFTLTTLWMGPSLYDGLNPDATGDSDMRFYDQDNLMGRGMSEYDVDQHYRREARQFVTQQPGRAVQLAVIKLWRYFKPWPNAEQFGGWGPALAIGPLFVIVMAFALRGWWMMRDDVWAWGLTLGPLVYFAAVHMVFVSSLRYRLPAEYPLTVLAAAGWQSWRGRREHSAAAAAPGG